jgi:hypothetical protein
VAAHVKSDGDAVAVPLDDRGGPFGVLQRGGADVHAGRSGLQRGGQRVVVTHAAGHLDVDLVAELMNNLTQLRAVVPRAERRIQIDEMNPLGAGLDPRAGRFERAAVVGL